MTDRDELADLIAAKLDGDQPEGWASPCEEDWELADQILARWRLAPVKDAWQVNVTECQACQHRAADELTRHDQNAGIYDDTCPGCGGNGASDEACCDGTCGCHTPIGTDNHGPHEERQP